jgi:voltage-dependent potassium channel beta subunit
MEYRRLGKSGLQVSALSFGSWLTFGQQIGDDVAEDLMIAAYDHGINFFDNAETYANGQSEIVMGKILQKLQWDRSSYIVSSKVFFGTGGNKPNQTGLSRKHIVEACHAAMKRLQMDYLDLYFCHRPDPNVPMEEIVWTMTQLIQQGKILYWGTSEWSAQEIMEAYLVAERDRLIPPVMEQPQYNMFVRNRVEVEYRHLYRLHGLGTTIWSPLASGLLSGKYAHGMPENTRLNMEGMDWLKNAVLKEDSIQKTIALQSIADDLGVSMACMSLAWCLKNPNVSTVILGGSKTSQLAENIKSLDVVPLLNEEVMTRIEDVLNNKSI